MDIEIENAKNVIALCQLALEQSLLDVATLLELSGSSIAGCTFLAGVHQSDNIKALTVSFRNMFEDSKIDRPKRDEKVDKLICSWLHTCAQLQLDIVALEKQLKVYSQDNIAVARDTIRDIVTDYQGRVEDTSTRLGSLIYQIYESIAGPCIKKLPESPPALEAVAEVKDEDAIRFIESLKCSPPLPPSEMALALASEDLVDAVSVFHTVVQSLIAHKKISVWNAGYKKLPKKKLSLKFGKGISTYAEGSFPNYLDTEDIDTVKRNLVELSELFDRCITTTQISNKKPKVAKGCIDFGPVAMRIREEVFDHVRGVFKLYGAEPIDTPVFELKEVLTGKYGEDSKLIYDLKDQGGEQLSLRYDLTVPFARYCSTNNVDKIKRYHIGKVYRRDEPQIARGRYREFYQCDVDIAGAQFDPMIPESEILAMLCHILGSLKPVIGEFSVKLSHRLLLDGMMEFCGVPESKIRSISSAIDKLDKESWAAVRQEMVETKGLDPAVADKLAKVVCFSGSITETISKLEALEIDNVLVTTNPKIKEALAQMQLLNSILPESIKGKLDFNTALARGLDYYTGLIYEAVMISGTDCVGSIAAGGRYDNLIGMFSGKAIPAIGVSIGIERVFRLIDEKIKIADNMLSFGDVSLPISKCDCYIASVGDVEQKTKFDIAHQLRGHGISCEYSLKSKVAFKKELQNVLDLKCPVALIIGQSELEQKKVKVKVMRYDGSNDSHEEEVPIESLPVTVADILAKHRSRLSNVLFQ